MAPSPMSRFPLAAAMAVMPDLSPDGHMESRDLLTHAPLHTLTSGPFRACFEDAL
jgi:hypothetical protein